MSHINVLIAV